MVVKIEPKKTFPQQKQDEREGAIPLPGLRVYVWNPEHEDCPPQVVVKVHPLRHLAAGDREEDGAWEGGRVID